MSGDMVDGPGENTGSNYPDGFHLDQPTELAGDRNKDTSRRYLRSALFTGVAYLTDFLFRVLVDPCSCSGLADIAPTNINIGLSHIGRVQDPRQGREGLTFGCYRLTVALGTYLMGEPALILLFLTEFLGILHPLGTTYRTRPTPYTIDGSEIIGVNF